MAPNVGQLSLQNTTTTSSTTTHVNLGQSQQLVRSLLNVGFGCITFLRGLFPDENFSEERIGLSSASNHTKSGIRVKKLQRGCTPEGDQLLDWIEHGVFDAMEKRFLRSVVFGVFLDPEKPYDLVESYTFNFAYYYDGIEVSDGLGNTIGTSSKECAQELQQVILGMCAYLDDTTIDCDYSRSRAVAGCSLYPDEVILYRHYTTQL